MTEQVRLWRDDALSPDALSMIDESEAEQAAIYPPEVRYAFSPEQLLNANVRFFTAYRGDVVVGCGGIAPLDSYGELKRIFVTRPARGTKVADAIMDRLEAEARDLGLPVVRLETGQDSPAAIRLYERRGYRRIEAFGDYVENGSSVFMEKQL